MVPALPYRHVQRVPRPAAIAFAAFFLLVLLGFFLEAHAAFWIGGGVLGYVLLAFHSLGVEVRPGELWLRYGWIGPRRRIDLARVRAVREVRSRPLFGWGIRWIPRGWMWNVWGLDAVELELERGRRFWVGTNCPAELAAAVELARRSSAPPPEVDE